jgi:hypothetical protein
MSTIQIEMDTDKGERDITKAYVVKLTDKIAELEEEQVDDYLEASTYAISLFNAHYKNKADAVPIELCDTTRGVVTQIDNMVTGVMLDMAEEITELKKEPPAPRGLWVTSKDLHVWQLEQQAKGVEDYANKTGGLPAMWMQSRIDELRNQAKALKERE